MNPSLSQLVVGVVLLLVASVQPLASSERPQPGDKLGYSKEESSRLLEPEVRQFLDVLLRFYREPGLFTNRTATMAALGIDQMERRWLPRSSVMAAGEPTHFEDQFARQRIFARHGWRGHYRYDGWRNKGNSWYVELFAEIDRGVECIDSRAVEGYLDLFLQTGLEGKPHPPSRERWDRHGNYGSPYALATKSLTPSLGMTFTQGCLTRIGVYGGFEYKEIGDDRIFN